MTRCRKYCLNGNLYQLRTILPPSNVEKKLIGNSSWCIVEMVFDFTFTYILTYSTLHIIKSLHTNITQRPTLGVKITRFGWGNVPVMWAWFSHLLVDLWHVKVELRWKMTIETATIKNLASIRLVIKFITLASAAHCP